MQSVSPFSSLVGPTPFILWAWLCYWTQFFHLWWSSGYSSLRCWKMWSQNADSRHENLFTRACQTFRCRLSLIYLCHHHGLNAHSQQLLDFKTQCIFHSLWPWDCNVQMWTMKRFIIFLILRPAHVGIQQPPLAMLLHLPPEQATYNMLYHISITAKNPEDTALRHKKGKSSIPQSHRLNFQKPHWNNTIITGTWIGWNKLARQLTSIQAQTFIPLHTRMNSLLILQNTSYVFSGCLL